MRRSCAPSMRKAKQQEQNKPNNVTSTDAESPTDYGNYAWGTRASKPQSGSFTAAGSTDKDTLQDKEDFFSERLIFKIMYREISKKKHKTWHGDGVLEVHAPTKRAVLKDETGKYLGSSTLFKMPEWTEGLEIIIGGKEIELQEQVKTKKEYFELRKLQVESRGWGEEELQVEEPVAKKSKTTGVVYPNLVEEMLKKNKENKSLNVQQQQHGWAKQELTGRSTIRKVPDFVSPLRCEAPQKTATTGVSQADIKLEALVLSTPNVDNKEARPLQDVSVASSLVRHLRPHQREGVAFLYDCLMGFQQPGYYGCILADEMGLGKTLQCLTVAHTLLTRGPFDGQRVIQRVLIATPSSLTKNWELEISKWLKQERMYAFVVDSKHKLASYSKQHHVPFVIVSYEMLLSQIEEFQRLEFDLLICDEGHRLKNQATKLFVALRELEIQRRVILTGTPLQNDLQEFYALADFVNPGVLGTYAWFRKYYELPLQLAQTPQVDEETKELADERSAELSEISAKFLLRRLQQVNCQYLPKKHEYICFVQPSELQQLLLQKALDLYIKSKASLLKDLSPFQIITVLKKICNHPSLIARTATPNLLTRYLERCLPDWSEMGPFDSSKLELVQHFLNKTAVERREKCVLVSNHTKTLNMLQGLCDHLNLNCLRLDGATPIKDRTDNVEKFNAPSTGAVEEALVFLLSAKAGGVGLNLTGASRLILFDSDWNPATDAQAMSRIWRDGQQCDVHIYRLITAGCIEEKIFQRQVAKMTLGDCVMQSAATNSNDAMKFSAEELLDLFTLQQNFESCQTHASIGCECAGNGNNLLDPGDSSTNIQMNELVRWRHLKRPFNADFLQNASIELHNESLFYVFYNESTNNQ